ncbi:MAG: hypothetical protein KKC20_22525 [Proteobacteria bacterium]|nr:hypothetical protein [Pseudomonadota bacterium]
MELLILKSNQHYIRVREDGFETVNLDRASVFPMDQMDRVRDHAARLKTKGFESVHIRKLILSETDL